MAVDDPDFFYKGTLVAVLTAEPLPGPLDYLVPEGGCLDGAFVQVPLGPRKVLGVVWGTGRGGFDLNRARQILQVLDVAPMPPAMKDFLTRAADYTLTPLSAMLRLATRAPGLTDPPSMRKVYQLGAVQPDRMTDARLKVLTVLKDMTGQTVTLKELTEIAHVSPSVVKGLVAQNAVLEMKAPRDAPFPQLEPAYPGKKLTDDQTKAADQLAASIRTGGYGATLLRGVTGSGKTEVYLEAVSVALQQRQQVLVLLPEIALTAEFLTRIETRFGARPAEWHSGVTMTERRRTWKMVGQGKAQVVVGARSALFLPFQSLGLIVVDEEHDSSYKQEDGVLYNARDMAVLRASVEGVRIVLASATPSLESWANAAAGKYTRLDLNERFGPAVMPELQALDMRVSGLPSGRWISPVLEQEMRNRIAVGEQALLFVNRRGYAPVTLCRACGQQVGCEHCDARMVEHKFLNRLMCHQCGETRPMPETCPSCDVPGRLAAIGPGVERLTDEAQELFPDARIVTLSSDLFSTGRELKTQIEEIAKGGADIIVGTQLVAKGHNFPKLTFVGVIDADLGLQGSDLRAAERTFQLMRQVAGRAGRAERPGVAMLQTYQPEHPVIRAILSDEEETFWQAEAQAREQAGMPPYGRLAAIIISSTDMQEAFGAGNKLARFDTVIREVGAQVFGPASAPIARIRGRHRVRLLVKAPKGAALQPALKQWIRQVKPSGQLRLNIDIDPQSFY